MRERRFQELDLDNLIEEVDSLARAEMRDIRLSVTEIIVSTLLLRAAPAAKERWELDSCISHHRIRIDVTVESNPILKPMIQLIVGKKRDKAVKLAVARLAALDYPGADSLDVAISLENVLGLYAEDLIN